MYVYIPARVNVKESSDICRYFWHREMMRVGSNKVVSTEDGAGVRGGGIESPLHDRVDILQRLNPSQPTSVPGSISKLGGHMPCYGRVTSHRHMVACVDVLACLEKYKLNGVSDDLCGSPTKVTLSTSGLPTYSC